jgi:pimeloyl-ACP methyl ester carboxylesterase
MELPVWDIQGDKPDGPLFILCHGWGDSRIGGLTRVPALADFASRLILWDMPGHGDAPGTCALGIREVSALFELIEHLGQPVVLYGWSLGAGVSLAAGAVSPSVTRIIAEAPYRFPWTPARNVLSAFGLPWRVNLPLAIGILGARFGVGPRWTGFDRLPIATSLTMPYLVLHGELDEICPVEDGSQIADANPLGQAVIIKEAGHHSLWTDPAHSLAMRSGIESFFKITP